MEDGREVDHKAAQALLESVQRTARELEMKQLETRVLALQEILRDMQINQTTTVEPVSSLHGVTGELSLFRREGDYWTVCYEGQTCRLKHTSGLAYIAQLLREPGRELHALALVSGSPADASSSLNWKSVCPSTESPSNVSFPR